MTKFKIGDKIVFGKRKKNRDLLDVTIGKIYTVKKNRFGKLCFLDDIEDENVSGMPTDDQYSVNDGVATKIIN